MMTASECDGQPNTNDPKTTDHRRRADSLAQFDDTTGMPIAAPSTSNLGRTRGSTRCSGMRAACAEPRGPTVLRKINMALDLETEMSHGRYTGVSHSFCITALNQAGD